MKNFSNLISVSLLAICFAQTACNNPVSEKVLPQASINARLIGDGGALIILEDPCAVPSYSNATFVQASNGDGCLTVEKTLSADCQDVVIAYKAINEDVWEGIFINGNYDNGVVEVSYTLPCMNGNTEYDIKVTALPADESDNVTVGETTLSCANCQ